MRFGKISRAPFIETLEGRRLLSAAPLAAHHAARHTATPAVHKPARPKGHVTDPIFMQISGVNGEVTLKGFAKDIQLNSFQWGVGRGISSPTGGTTDRETSAPSVSEITISKVMDKTSQALLADILQGTSIPEVDIYFVNVTKTPQATSTFTYAQYVLSNVLLSGYSVSSGGERPSESLSLNFTKVKYTYNTLNADGTTTSSTVTYDLTLAKTV